MDSEITSRPNTRYLYIQLSTSDPKPDLMIDSLTISYSNADTLGFFLKKNPTKKFYKSGPKIRLIEGLDSFLMYDYSLQENDTFFYKYKTNPDTFLVDSIRTVKLENGLSYKHWHLRSIARNLKTPTTLVWIENLGEKIYGWNYNGYQAFHQAFVGAICSPNSELIFWNFYGVTTQDPQKTCDFDALKKFVGLREQTLSSVRIFPNPCADVLYIDSEIPVEYAIFDPTGKCLMKGFTDDVIQVGDLESGLYYLQIKHEKGLFLDAFIKE